MDIVPDLWEIAIKKSVTRMFLKKGKKLNYQLKQAVLII